MAAQGASRTRLHKWAEGLAPLTAIKPIVKTSPATVRTLAIRPHKLRLDVGSTARLTVTGGLQGGKSATPAELAAVTWSSKDPAVAKVNMFGKVLAKSAGTTMVTAKLGMATTFIWVRVRLADPQSEFGLHAAGLGSDLTAP